MKPTKGRNLRNVLIVIGIAAAMLEIASLVSRLLFSKRFTQMPATPERPHSPSMKGVERFSESNRVARAELTLRLATTRLNSAPSTKLVRDVLLELRTTLGNLPANAASQMVQQWLATGADARTRIPFALGPGGSLQDAPSLRVFLLDYLEQIDPAAAARVGLEVLKRMDSPDEWALALRSVAKFDPSQQSRALLEEKLRQEFSHEPWLRDPSVSYLESFDVAVHLGGINLLPDLTQLLRMTNNQAVAHAAFLATDRLVQRDPAPVLAALLADLGMMEGRESTRANYFARADVSNSAQQHLVENYLLHAQLAESELGAFADGFPNENSMLSNNLLTRSKTRTGSDIQVRDAATLQTVNTWLQDPRFISVTPQLHAIRLRLETFLALPPASSAKHSPKEFEILRDR